MAAGGGFRAFGDAAIMMKTERLITLGYRHECRSFNAPVRRRNVARQRVPRQVPVTSTGMTRVGLVPLHSDYDSLAVSG
jgi:hypothetical protein